MSLRKNRYAKANRKTTPLASWKSRQFVETPSVVRGKLTKTIKLTDDSFYAIVDGRCQSCGNQCSMNVVLPIRLHQKLAPLEGKNVIIARSDESYVVREVPA